jgi:hypothetical protein
MKIFVLLAGSALSAFNSQPTNGQRFCDFYTMKATAIFDNGYTGLVTTLFKNVMVDREIIW